MKFKKKEERGKKRCLFFFYLLSCIFVTADTTHLLISALKLVATQNATNINRNKKYKNLKNELKEKVKRKNRKLVQRSKKKTYIEKIK